MVDFAEDDDAGEFGLRVAGDDRVVKVYTWRWFNGCVILDVKGGGGLVRMLPLPSADVSTSWWVSLINIVRFFQG